MFRIASVLVPIIALVVIGLCLLFGLFNITLGGLLVAGAVLVLGVFIGMGLSRRSKTANRYYDEFNDNTYIRQLKAQLEEAEGKLQDYQSRNPDVPR